MTLDSLIIKLVLDASGLNKAAPEAGKKLKELEHQAKKNEEGTGKLNKTNKEATKGLKEMAVGFAALTAAIGITAVGVRAFVEDMIGSTAAVGRLSRNIGVSVEKITALGAAAEEVGGSSKEIDSALKAFTKSTQDYFNKGDDSIILFLNRLGLFPKAGQDAADAFAEINKQVNMLRANGMSDTKIHSFLEDMPGANESIINQLMLTTKAYDESIDRQKKLAADTAKTTKASAALQLKLADVKNQLLDLGLQIFGFIQPALKVFLDWLLKITAWADAHPIFTTIAIGVVALTGFLASLVIGVAALTTAFGALDFAAAPWLLIAAAVVAVIAGVVLLTTHLKNVKNEFNDLLKFAKAIMGVRSAADLVQVFKDKAAPQGAGTKTLPEAIAQVEGFNAKGDKQNRPQRDHNPGNIRTSDFATAHGAVGNDDGYAIFPDDDTGKKALYALLKTPGYANLTVDQAVAKWAPPKENNTGAYQASVRKMTGLSGDTRVSSALAGIRGASSTIASAGTRAAGNDNSSQVTVSMKDTVINTRATNAKELADDLGSQIKKSFNWQYVGQAAMGQS